MFYFSCYEWPRFLAGFFMLQWNEAGKEKTGSFTDCIAFMQVNCLFKIHSANS
jgi:hypothetical protein